MYKSISLVTIEAVLNTAGIYSKNINKISMRLVEAKATSIAGIMMVLVEEAGISFSKAKPIATKLAPILLDF